MLGLIDERLGVLDRAFFDQVRPELLGHVELHMDLQGLFDRDNLFVHRRVIQLAVRLMSRAGVVEHPRVTLSSALQSLQDGDIQLRSQLFCQRGKRGSHNPRADDHYVHRVYPPALVF